MSLSLDQLPALAHRASSGRAFPPRPIPYDRLCELHAFQQMAVDLVAPVADVVLGERPDRRTGGNREARTVGQRHGVAVPRLGDAVLIAQAIAHLVKQRGEGRKVAVDCLDRADVVVHEGLFVAAIL